MTTPATIANQALDAIGIGADIEIGDLEEGTREAKVCLRAYGKCLRQLLRGANWDFARKTAPLVLLADASGQTQNVGNMVPIPWIYEYSYPIDCMKMRFIPFNGYLNPPIPGNNIQIPPPTTAPGANLPSLIGTRLVPAPFLVATDYNYPPDPSLQYQEVQGQGQQGRTVILTNMQNAQAIYTAFISEPSLWDALFRGAFVSYLASEVALSLSKDIKIGMAIRGEQIKIVKAKLDAARIADGNEGTSSTDHLPDFMRVRSWGTAYGGGAVGPGGIGFWGGYGDGWGGGWDVVGFSDGSVY